MKPCTTSITVWTYNYIEIKYSPNRKANGIAENRTNHRFFGECKRSDEQNYDSNNKHDHRPISIEMYLKRYTSDYNKAQNQYNKRPWSPNDSVFHNATSSLPPKQGTRRK